MKSYTINNIHMFEQVPVKTVDEVCTPIPVEVFFLGVPGPVGSIDCYR